MSPLETLLQRLGLSRRLHSENPDVLRRDLDEITESGDERWIAPLLAQFVLLELRLPDARQRVVATLAAIARRNPTAVADALRNVSASGRPNATTETEERDDYLCRIERGLLADALVSPGTETVEGRAALEYLIQFTSDAGIWAQVGALKAPDSRPVGGSNGLMIMDIWARVAALDALSRARILPAEAFARALADPVTAVRRHAVMALHDATRHVFAARSAAALVPALSAAFIDPDATVRRSALQTINALEAVNALDTPTPASLSPEEMLEALERQIGATLSPQELAHRAIASGHAELMTAAGPAVRESILGLLPPRRAGRTDDATPALCQALAAVGDADALPAMLAATLNYASRDTISDSDEARFQSEMTTLVDALTQMIQRVGAAAPRETLQSIIDAPDAEYTLYDSGGHGSLRPVRVSLEPARNAARAVLRL